MEQTNPILGILGDVVTAIGDVLEMFLQPAVLPFIGLAFAGAAVGVIRKLIPVKKK